MTRLVWFAAVAAGFLAVSGAAEAKVYKLDKEHTTVAFRVRHLFTYVEGRFDQFDGQVELDLENAEAAKVSGSVDVGSINTNVKERDEHLRSKDFFYVEKHPKIEFTSTKLTDVDLKEKTGKLHGNLKIRGVEKPVVLDVAFLGEGSDPWGNKKAGFSAQTKINRKDFGLNWNEVLETGGLLVGEEVQIRIEVEAYVSDEK